MTPEQQRIAKANRLVYEAYNRPFIQCLRADSVKVTFGKDSPMMRRIKQSWDNARQYNKDMGLADRILCGTATDGEIWALDSMIDRWLKSK